MKLHHLGIACQSIEETLQNIEKLHGVTEKSEQVFDDKQQAYVQLVTLADGTKLELISGKIVSGLVAKKIGLYHVCYEVEDMKEALERAKANGADIVSMPKPSALFNEHSVAFLMFPYGLVEFLERN